MKLKQLLKLKGTVTWNTATGGYQAHFLGCCSEPFYTKARAWKEMPVVIKRYKKQIKKLDLDDSYLKKYCK